MTCLTKQISIEFQTTITNPPFQAGRIAVHQGMIRHIARHYGTRAHHRKSADVITADDSAIGTQRSAFMNYRRAHFIHSGDTTSRIMDVCK